MDRQQQRNLFTVSPTLVCTRSRVDVTQDTGYLNWSWTLHSKQEAPCSALLVQDAEGLKDLYLDTNPESEKH